MLYVILGTNKELRDKAKKELKQLGEPHDVLYVEHKDRLLPLAETSSLFGGKMIVECVQILEGGITVKEEVYALLPTLESSETIFIFDEPFADVHKANKLAKFAKKVFDGREEKVKDTSVFTFADQFMRRDKKAAWASLLTLKETHEAEAVQGALWWKFTEGWKGSFSGRRRLFSEKEYEIFGKKLLLAPILAHQGKADLFDELEKVTLSL